MYVSFHGYESSEKMLKAGLLGLGDHAAAVARGVSLES